jgi:hypothetical protein
MHSEKDVLLSLKDGKVEAAVSLILLSYALGLLPTEHSEMMFASLSISLGLSLYGKIKKEDYSKSQPR